MGGTWAVFVAAQRPQSTCLGHLCSKRDEVLLFSP